MTTIHFPVPSNPTLAQLLKQLTIDTREGRITQEEKVFIKEELLGRREFETADTTSDGSSGSEDEEADEDDFNDEDIPEIIKIGVAEQKKQADLVVSMLRQLNEHVKRGAVNQPTKAAIKDLLLSGRSSDIEKAQKMIALALKGPTSKEEPTLDPDLKFDYKKAKHKQLEELALISRALGQNFHLVSTGPGIADRHGEPDTKTDLTFRVTLNIIFDGIAVDFIFSMPPKYPYGARPSFYIDASFGLSRGDLMSLSSLINNEIHKQQENRELLVPTLVTMAQSFVLEMVQFSSEKALSPSSAQQIVLPSLTTKPTIPSSSATTGPWAGLSRVRIPDIDTILKHFPNLRGYPFEKIHSDYLEYRFARKRATLPPDCCRAAIAFADVVSSIRLQERRGSTSSVDSKGDKLSRSDSGKQKSGTTSESSPRKKKSGSTTVPEKSKSDKESDKTKKPLKVDTTSSLTRHNVIHSWSMSLGHTFSSPETALYGRGIYLHPSPSFALSQKRGAICICLVLRGRVHKCNNDPMGSWLKRGHHSHQSPDERDIVVFDSDQILPLYLVHFKSSRPSPLPSPDLSPRASFSRSSHSGSGTSSGGSTPRSRGSRSSSRGGSRPSTPASRNSHTGGRSRPGTPASRNSHTGRPSTPASRNGRHSRSSTPGSRSDSTERVAGPPPVQSGGISILPSSAPVTTAPISTAVTTTSTSERETKKKRTTDTQRKTRRSGGSHPHTTTHTTPSPQRHGGKKSTSTSKSKGLKSLSHNVLTSLLQSLSSPPKEKKEKEKEKEEQRSTGTHSSSRRSKKRTPPVQIMTRPLSSSHTLARSLP